MPKLIMFNLITLDGYFEGPNGDIEWHNVDEEFNQFSVEQLDAAGGLVFGRVTYQLMESYWPAPEAMTDNPAIAERMNNLPKWVFSNTLAAADWSNTTLVNGDAGLEMEKLKQQQGGDLLLFGSADLASVLIQRGLIDEFRILVNPIVLGSGQPLFRDLNQPLRLQLIKSRAFNNGNVLLYYQLPEL